MSQSAIYAISNRVIKRITKEAVLSYNAETEAAQTVADNFILASGPWKFDASFNKVQASAQEYIDATADLDVKELRRALVEFAASVNAYKSARQSGSITTAGQFLPYFDGILRDLGDSLSAIYKTVKE